MPHYNVIIQPEAEKDLDELYDYFEDQRSGLGFDLLAQLTEVIQLLEERPKLFQKVYKNKRRAVIKRFGCNIIYKIIDQDVYILAIMHGRRDPKNWRENR